MKTLKDYIYEELKYYKVSHRKDRDSDGTVYTQTVRIGMSDAELKDLNKKLPDEVLKNDKRYPKEKLKLKYGKNYVGLQVIAVINTLLNLNLKDPNQNTVINIEKA